MTGLHVATRQRYRSKVRSFEAAIIFRPCRLALLPSSPMSSTHYDLLMLFLRVIAGTTIFMHGYNKIFRGGKIEGTAGWFDSMGMKPNGKVHAWAAALTETGCGVLLVLGLLTPLAAAGLIGVMVVAGVTTHSKAFFITKEGFEFVMILGTLFFAISAFGPGAISLDGLLGLSDGPGDFLGNTWMATVIPLVLGFGSGLGLLALCYRPPTKSKG